MKQAYRALWNISIGVHRKHYFICEDHELSLQQALEQELEQIGEPIPKECDVERVGLPFEDAQEKVCYRLAYHRIHQNKSWTHYIVTFYAHDEKEARDLADWVLKQFKYPYQEESFTKHLTRMIF